MTDFERDHDRLLRAARAAFAAAQDLDVSEEQRECLLNHEVDQHVRRLEKQYQEERAAHDVMRDRFNAVLEAVGVYGRRMTILFRLVIALGIIAAVVAGVQFNRLANLAKSNREGIRVSCVVISNAIIQSGASGASTNTPASRATREIQEIYVRAIQRQLLTTEDLARVKYLSRIVVRSGGLVAVPDCDEIAQHPERVKRLVLEAKKRAATP